MSQIYFLYFFARSETIQSKKSRREDTWQHRMTTSERPSLGPRELLLCHVVSPTVFLRLQWALESCGDLGKVIQWVCGGVHISNQLLGDAEAGLKSAR